MAESGSAAGEVERRDLPGQIREGARIIREQWWLVALCLVVSVAVAAIYDSNDRQFYFSTSRLLLLQSDPNAAVLQGAVFTDPARERATDIELVEQRPVAEQVVDRLDLDLSAGNVLSKISTDVQGDSNVLSVTATDEDPAATAPVANAFAQEFVDFQRDTQKRRYREALALVEARIERVSSEPPGRRAELERLRRQARELRLLGSLQTGDAQVIELASGPGAATGSDTTRHLVLGGVLGLLLGLGLAFLRDRLDPRLKTEDQVRRALPDVPIIGSIPKIGRTAASREAAAEGFHLLQSDIELLGRRETDLRYILVTSALPADGKSSTAANLALAMAQRGSGVILVEADARRPELSQRWGVSGPGTADVLRGDATVEEVVRTQSVAAEDGRQGPHLAIDGQIRFVAAGDAGGDYRKLLNGGSFGDFMGQLSQRYPAAVIDGPPLGLFSDVAPLARLVDGVILVVRLGHSRGPALRRLGERLARSSVKPIGIVVLGASADANEYGSYPG